MTYGELPKQPKPGVTLYCPECNSHFSAYRGDYFQRQADESIVCLLHRGASLYLVMRQHCPPRVIAPVDAEDHGSETRRG